MKCILSCEGSTAQLFRFCGKIIFVYCNNKKWNLFIAIATFGFPFL